MMQRCSKDVVAVVVTIIIVIAFRLSTLRVEPEERVAAARSSEDVSKQNSIIETTDELPEQPSPDDNTIIETRERFQEEPNPHDIITEIQGEPPQEFPTPYDVDMTMRQRRLHLKESCQLSHSRKVVNVSDMGYSTRKRLSKHDESKLLYCGIEKIGSSFWKRIFKVLVTPKRKRLHVFDMPYYKAHNSIPHSMSMKHVSAHKLRTILTTYTSFMFTRDPFARLFSGYIDKIVLPNDMADKFYLGAIMDKYRKSIPDLCPYNVTFELMSEFVADAILSNTQLEGHFSPIYKHCLPCDINYTFVGKMESFMDDTNHILSSVGLKLSDVTGQDEVETDDMSDKGAISDLANLTFEYIASRDLKCLKKSDILHKIWRVYQTRGVISKHDALPRFNDVDGLTSAQFISAACDVYDHSDSARSERQLQRDEALAEAFSSLPKALLRKLSRAFAMDCRLFDYDCHATERFPKQAKKTSFSYLQYSP